MDKKEKEIHPVEYNYLEKHNPYFWTKRLSFKNTIESFYKVRNNKINIEFEEYYTDAEKLRDDIVSYIRNEMPLYCEALDNHHFLIEGDRYVLNVTHGGSHFNGQSTTLYREDI